MKVVKLIKTEKENERALKEIERLMTKPKLTKAEDDYLELLFVLVENFEKKAYPLDGRILLHEKRPRKTVGRTVKGFGIFKRKKKINTHNDTQFK